MDETGQNDRAGVGSNPETGVQHRAGGLLRLAVGPDEEELSGRDTGGGRKSPCGRTVVIGAEIQSGQTDDVAAGIIQFNPRIAFAEIIGMGRSGFPPELRSAKARGKAGKIAATEFAPPGVAAAAATAAGGAGLKVGTRLALESRRDQRAAIGRLQIPKTQSVVCTDGKGRA